MKNTIIAKINLELVLDSRTSRALPFGYMTTINETFDATPEGVLAAANWIREYDARRAEALTHAMAWIDVRDADNVAFTDFVYARACINGHPVDWNSPVFPVPESYLNRANMFALFNRVTVPNMPSPARIARDGLREGVDYPAHCVRVQREYKRLVDLGVKTAVIFIQSRVLLECMRRFPDLFGIDEYGVWAWSGNRPLWRILDCMRECGHVDVDYLPVDYNSLPKNSGTSNASRSDACERTAAAALSRRMGQIMEWVGQQKRGDHGAYRPDIVHYNANGEIDFICEVKGLGGRFAVNLNANRARNHNRVLALLED